MNAWANERQIAMAHFRQVAPPTDPDIPIPDAKDITWQYVAIQFFALIKYLATVLSPLIAGGALYYGYGAKKEAGQAVVNSEVAAVRANDAVEQGQKNQGEIQKVGRQVKEKRSPFE